MSIPSVNPYASPQMLSVAATQDVYFSTATKNLSIREYWWLAKNPLEFVFGVVFKLLRVNLPASFGIAHPRFLQVLSADDLPTRARDRMAPSVTEALELGFEPCLRYTIPHLGPFTAFATALRSRDGTILIGIAYAQGVSGGVEHEVCKFFLGSYLQDGRVISTLGGKPDLESPPEVVRESLRNRSIALVLDRHRQRLWEFDSLPIVIRDNSAAERIIRQREERVFDFQCERGVFVQLADHALQRLAASTANPPLPGTLSPSAGCAGTLAWLVLLLGLFLIMLGPPVNPKQWFIGIAVLALGMAGVAASWAVGHLRAARARDGARSRS